MSSVVSVLPRPVTQAPQKATPSIIQAAPTVYTAPPATKRPDLRAQRQARMVKTPHTYSRRWLLFPPCMQHACMYEM